MGTAGSEALGPPATVNFLLKAKYLVPYPQET